jgi:hypothetical protein
VLYDAEVDGKEVRVHAGNMKPFWTCTKGSAIRHFN